MSFIAGDIMIRMAADVASLKTDMKNAESAVSNAFDNMKTAAKALGGLFAVGEIVAWGKAAIDAGDNAKTLADRVGLSVYEVTALSAAFKAGGADAEAVKTSLTKLSKEVFDNEATFKALGIEVKGAGGEYKSVDTILGEVADLFASMPDGITKTKLATELFGKSGADLIPVLNGGKDGLESMKDEAKALGAAISDEAAAAADDFNDKLALLKDSAIALTLKGLAPILVALSDVATVFTSFKTSTKDASDQIGPFQTAIITAIQAISTLILNVSYVLTTLGKEIGVIAAQAVAFISGDFAGAKKIGEEWREEAKKLRAEVDAQSAALLSAGTNAKAHTDALEAGKPKIKDNAEQLAQAALRIKEDAAERKKAADAIEKQNQELDKLAAAIKAEQAGYTPEFLKKLEELKTLRNTGRISVEEYAKAVKDLTDKQPLVKTQIEAERKELELLAARQLDAIKNYEAQEQKMDAALKSAEGLVAGIESETAALTMSNTEREISNALLALEKAGLEKGSYAYEQYAEKIRSAIIDREAVRESIEKTKEIEAEWKKASDNLTNGLTDALMRGFESGKGFAENLKDYIKNAFKTLVADFVIRPIMAPISGALTSLFSGNAMAGTGGAGGGLGSLLSAGMNFLNGSTMNGIGLNIVNSGLGQSLGLSSLQNIGGNMIAGPTGLGSLVSSGLGMLGNGMAGFGISSALSGGYSLGGKNVVNGIAGIASMIPGIGPIAGVVGGLINRAFGMKAKEMKDFGITGTITGGDATGQKYQDWFQKGGWFRSNRSGTDFSALGDDLSAALDLGAKNVLEQTKAWAQALNLPAESLANVTANFKVKLTDNEAENQAAIELIFEGYQNALTDQFSAILEPFQNAGESIADTMQRLVALGQVSEQLNTLGGIFSRVATASIGARENIIGLAGGIEQLMAKAGQFVKDYYSVEEQAGLQASSTLQILRDIGLDGTAITSREDFRRLVESIDVSTSQGQEQLVALLDIAPQFATLADYLKESNLTLEEVAAQAPVVAILDQMLPEQVSTTEAVGTVADRISEGNATLERIVESIQAGNVSIATGLQALASAQASVASLQAQANAIAAQTARAVGDMANNTSLNESAPNFTVDIGGSSRATD